MLVKTGICRSVPAMGSEFLNRQMEPVEIRLAETALLDFEDARSLKLLQIGSEAALMTYDHVFGRAKRILGCLQYSAVTTAIPSYPSEEIDSDDIPF